MECSYELFNSLSNDAKRIFNLLQKKGPMTKSEISTFTNIKLTTLNRIMNPMEKDRIIVEYCAQASTGGRKPIMYNINLCNFYIIGIDIADDCTEIIFTNLKLEILEKRIISGDNKNIHSLAEKIFDLINKVIREVRLDFLKLFGVGIAFSSSYYDKYETTYEWTNIKNIFEEKLGCTVFVEKGANAAAIAEYFYGFKGNFESVAYFNYGENIRLGVISKGKILNNPRDFSSTFENMIVNDDGFNMRYIKDYCLPKYLVNKFVSKVRGSQVTIMDKSLENINYKDVCLAADKGDRIAKSIIEEAAVIFSIGLINYINILNIKSIVLDGPMIFYSEFFYKTCEEFVLKKLKVVFEKYGHFKEDTVAIGSAAVAVQKYLES